MAFDLLCFVFGAFGACVKSLLLAVWMSCALSFTFSWKHNAAALITLLIGQYHSIQSKAYIKYSANLCRDVLSSQEHYVVNKGEKKESFR